MTQTKPAVTASSTGKWKTYPAYKDSGVEWLGEVSAHWEVKRLKYIAPASTAKLIEKPDDLPYLGLENIESKTGRLLLDTPVENVESTVGIFDKGNVLFGKLRPYLAKVVCVDFRGVCTTELLVLQPNDVVNGKFLFYRLLSEDFVKLVNSLTYGTKMPRVSSEQIGNLAVQLPPFPEQNAIITYLDRETARISALIAKKERLVELLQEKRAALISHAVTKGLDPTVPMKDSGVEWLGRIPVNWRIGRIGIECTVKARLGWKGLKASEYVDEGYIFLSTPNIKGRDIDFENVNYINAERYFESPEIMLKVGDVLVAKDGSTLGITSVIRSLPAPATVNSSIAVIRPFELLDSIFLYWFLSSNYVQGFIQRMKGGMGVPHLFQADLRKFVVLVPSIAQQRVIATYLDRETAKIDALISRIREGIEKLKEYSTALISAAVTGKIDVRGEILSKDDETSRVEEGISTLN